MARIMIAEDESSVRTLLVRAFAQDGHEVESAPDGAAALDHLAKSAPFDLLLSDIQMPLMDGIALALAAKRDHPALTILLMTGYTDQRERAQSLRALIHDIVQKPFTVAEIRAAVTAALAVRV
ncbi:MAG TPA: response regulator [Xanthobacteraceae bacterium]|jgi:CheY-like chemotaxis protein|nr:response regulator [Xanthobacteraceae bacterium]